MDEVLMTENLSYEELAQRLAEETRKRKQAEAENSKLRHHLNSVTRSMREDLMIIDRNFVILEVNDHFLTKYGGPLESILGRTCYETTHRVGEPCVASGCPCPVSEVFATGKPVQVEHIHKDRDGKEVNIEIYGYPIFGKEGKVEQVVEVHHDITDRRRAEKERINREKLNSILEMSGAVCHELNQPMQVVTGYSELLLKALSEDSTLYKQVQSIVENIERMVEITNNLQNITRYETKEYITGTKIVDIDRASGTP